MFPGKRTPLIRCRTEPMVYAIYFDKDVPSLPYALCRYDASKGKDARGATVQRADDVGALRQFIADAETRRMECLGGSEEPHASFEPGEPAPPLVNLGRDPGHDPRSLVEIWARPDR